MRIFLILIAMDILLGWLAVAADAQVAEFDLDNGIHVIVISYEEAKDVGVETFYEVGFLDEPEGMVQSSHLLEHLICYGSGAGFGPKEAMQWLNKVGMGNAETMPDWTHYDYSAPAEDLEKILEIEAARLQQNSFDPDVIAFEAKRVYRETDTVENFPQAGMAKHAFMALAHAWKFQSQFAPVRGGLDEMDPGKLLKFYQATYQPRNLTIAICGKVDKAEAESLVEKHLGKLKSKGAPQAGCDWTTVPKKSSVKWDSKHRAVCVAWNPPEKKLDQVMISLLSAVAWQKLYQDKALLKHCEMVSCTSNSWFAGDLPVYVYAMAKPEADLDQIEKMIAKKYAETMSGAATGNWQMVRSFAHQLEFQQKDKPWSQIQQAEKMLTRMGRPADKAMQMVLTQEALMRGSAYRLLGQESKQVLAELKKLNKAKLSRLVDETLVDTNRHVCTILPR